MRLFFILLLAFFLTVAEAQVQVGKASFYADSFDGKSTASGEKYRPGKLTAAHRTLPFGTIVKVTNLANSESVTVTINERGPFVESRVIDLSKAAAEKLKFISQGTAEVKIEMMDGGVGKGKLQPALADHGAVEEKEFYNVDISKAQPKGFGVQLATYQEMDNLFHIANGLKNIYKKNAVVQVKAVKGVKHYSLILGPFSSSTKAQRFVSELKKQFPDAFVLDYAKP